MKENKKLLLKENVTINGCLNLTTCSVEIYERSDMKKEVVLSTPENIERYAGGSTTNFFEELATKIKRGYLADTLDQNILWIDRQVYTNQELFPTLEKRVSMDFDGQKYSNPKWGGLNDGV